MRKLRLISKILLSLLLGLVLALAWFQFDERFIALANNGMEKVFEHQLNCHFKGKVKRLNPFFLTLDFENVQVRPFDKAKNWSWNAAQMTMRLSFLEYLYYGAFGLHVKLTGLRSFSGFKKNGIPDVNDHLLDLFAGANFSVPISFQTVAIVDGALQVNDPDKKIVFMCSWNSNAGKAGKDFKSKFYLSHTSLTFDDKKIFEDFRGQVTFDALHNNTFVRVTTDAMLILPQLPEDQQNCYFTGSWDKNAGSFVFYNQDRTLSFVPIDIVFHKGTYLLNAEGVVLLEYLKRFLAPEVLHTVNGVCRVKFSGDVDGFLQGKIQVQNVGYQSYDLDNIYCNIMRSGALWRGTIAGKKNDAYVTGVWEWSNVQKQGTLQLLNKTVMPLFSNVYWESLPGNTALQAFFKDDGTGWLTYTTEFMHKKTEHTVKSFGKASFGNNKIECEGSVGDAQYQGIVQKKPFWLESFICKNNQNKEFVTFTTEKQRIFSLSVDYSAAQILALDWFGIDLPGHGIFKIVGSVDFPKIGGTFSFKDGAIRSVGMYNFISDISACFMIHNEKKECTLENVLITLHQGKIISNKISCFFNKDGSLYGLHSPVKFEHCFFNWNKYLYALCTGSAVLHFGSGIENSLDGFLILERSQFKENIFALQTQQNTFSVLPKDHVLNSMRLNMGISTQKPLVVTTEHLQTQALLDCSITGSLSAPELQGSLQLRRGKLIFPGQTLAISQGKLTFLPTHSDDPLIELTAQARIKKYLVTLTIGGTIKEPEVFLQSTPELSEEQIIMLLLTGSEQESLNVMAPSLVMRNVETILFGPSKTLVQAPGALSSWLKPLEKVTFIPRFNDQSGKGGFKGVLEVEVSKRLRAVLEKDFNLIEDASAEIEYLVSDDISFKVNRDERGDIGAEVEMRFKF